MCNQNLGYILGNLPALYEAGVRNMMYVIRYYSFFCMMIK